jgi:putative ABC transport system ATP-binding protein
MAILELENLSYSYVKGKKVLKDLNYKFDSGKLYAIVGRSGSGKTTLLSLLSGLNVPNEGKIVYHGKDLSDINHYDYRAQSVGVVFQSFNLLPHLTVGENIMLSMDASKKKFDQPKEEIMKQLLDKVRLDRSYANRKILHLSGGEQQRIAIARTLSINPEIILADEPTGNLDLSTQDDIMQIFSELAHNDGKCIIIVTHSPDVARQVDEVYELESLRVTSHKA